MGLPRAKGVASSCSSIIPLSVSSGAFPRVYVYLSSARKPLCRMRIPGMPSVMHLSRQSYICCTLQEYIYIYARLFVVVLASIRAAHLRGVHDLFVERGSVADMYSLASGYVPYACVYNRIYRTHAINVSRTCLYMYCTLPQYVELLIERRFTYACENKTYILYNYL